MEFVCAGQIWWRLAKSFLICVDVYVAFPVLPSESGLSGALFQQCSQSRRLEQQSNSALQFSCTIIMNRFLAHAVVVITPFGNVKDMEDSGTFALVLPGPSSSATSAPPTTLKRDQDIP